MKAIQQEEHHNEEHGKEEQTGIKLVYELLKAILKSDHNDDNTIIS